MKIRFFLPVAPVIMAVSMYGQPQTLQLWEGTIPGAIEEPSYKADTVYIDGHRPRVVRVTDPTLEFYPAPAERASGAAVVVCPGGGYKRLAIDHEGREVAGWLNELGIAAFVLFYRLPSDAIMKDRSVGPLQDGQQAIRMVRRHAREWKIDPNMIGIMGFSAGGHLASTVSTHFAERVYDPGDTVSARPDFAVLVYPVISMDTAITHRESRDSLLGRHPSEELVRHFSNERWVTESTPPTFIVHAANDKTVPAQNSVNYLEALRMRGVPCELHLYETGGHGFGLGKGGGTESGWPEACRRWLRARGVL